MEAKHMKTVIFCGGKGMRLHEETEFRPKPLIEIGGWPILWHVMRIYAHYGYRDFVLCLGYKGDMIKRYFLDYEAMQNDFTLELGTNNLQFHSLHQERGWQVTLANTGMEANTGTRLKRVQKYVDTDLFMVTYADGVANINIQQLVDFHRSHGKIGTITAVRPLSRFGELELRKDNIVETFREKAPVEGGYINGGFFVFDHRIFNYVKDDDACILEHEPLVRLAGDGQLAAYIHQEYWHCMDTYRDWETLNEEWAKSNPGWKIW